MKDYLVKYSRSCVTKLGKQVDSLKKGINPRGIHSMRVNVKKIRTLHALAESWDEQLADEKTGKIFEQLFRRSGVYREVQINMLLLEKYRSASPLEVRVAFVKLTKKKLKALKKLRKSIDKYNHRQHVALLEVIPSRLKTASDEEVATKSLAFANRHLCAIKGLLTSCVTDSLLHEVRILLKEFFYTLALFHGAKLQLSIGHEEIRTINQFQEKLGVWHDYDMLYITLLSLYKNPQKLHGITGTIEQQKRGLFDDLNAGLRTLAEMPEITLLNTKGTAQ